MIHPDAQSDTEPPHGGRIEDRTRNEEGSAYGQARVSKERQGPRPQEVQGRSPEAAGLSREIAPEVAGEPCSGHQTFAYDEARPTRTAVKLKVKVRKGSLSLVPRKRNRPLPSPLPTKHVAPPRPVLMVPARSMPPARDQRRATPVPIQRGPLVVPDFSEAGVLLAITYSIREGRRGEFFDLMRELKPLLASIGGTDCTVYEDRSRPNYLMEVFRFKDESEFTAFDDKFHKDRKIAAIYALLDDIVEAEKSDFKIFERRL